MRVFMLVPAVAALFAAQLPAQDTTELLNRMKAMEDRIKALEAEVQTLGEVRRGDRVALVGFPIANAAEVKALAEQDKPAATSGPAKASARVHFGFRERIG